MPTVSIITPLYNKAAYITNTILSVLNQTYFDWEMLIVDNGSTDGSWEIVQQVQDSRIQIMQSLKPGPGAARNYGLTHAQGEWIQFLDADDLLTPNHLEEQLAVARTNPHAEIIVGYWQEFTDENPTERIVKQPSGIGQPIEVLRNSAIAFVPWAVHAALVKRSALSADCYWPEQLDQYLGEDIAFWFPLINQCQVAYGQCQGALYRIHTVQCRTQKLNPEKWFTGVHAAIKLNQQWWQKSNHSYTPGQCENLMRVYSEIYCLAQQQKSSDVELQALSMASEWLREYFCVVHKPKLSMIIRRLIGIKLFLMIVKHFR
ncbi:glycosyltransferase family 2 protein [Coleofasciculus sp. E2-BRE-01]|uniref:glycosyltransferase family 2 protein n=1 Tax=Coleofasciculus sp. E2-BRE-01 TaxID=3069524 RepID=UPI0032F2CF9B